MCIYIYIYIYIHTYIYITPDDCTCCMKTPSWVKLSLIAFTNSSHSSNFRALLLIHLLLLHLYIYIYIERNYRDSALLLGLQVECATRKNILQLGNLVNC